MTVFKEIAIGNLQIGATNPRKIWLRLGEMQGSISEHGVMQNLIVRPVADGKYEVIAGQRRLLACLGRVTSGEITEDYLLPCMVRDLDDAAALEVALIENSQRQDLHPLDEGRGYLKLWTSYREQGRSEAGALVTRLAVRAEGDRGACADGVEPKEIGASGGDGVCANAPGGEGGSSGGLSDAEFSAVLVAHTKFLRQVAGKLRVIGTDMEDVVQDAMERAWTHRATFRAGTNFKAWSAMILRNKFLSDKRRSWRAIYVDPQDYDFGLVQQPVAEDRIELKRLLGVRMSRQQKQALMQIVDGATYEEVALEEGTSLGTIKSRVARARAVLGISSPGETD